MNKVEPGDYRTEVVKDCPGFRSISERLGELIATMKGRKEREELPAIRVIAGRFKSLMGGESLK